MNLLGKEPSYRQLSRLADLKGHNDNQKRMFGRDITNLQRKQKKNASIYEKISIPKLESKTRSRSLYGRKENLPPQVYKDAIHEYKQDVIDFMVEQQRPQSQQEQKEITHKMRQILIDWLIDVHDSFDLKQQTLHLALSYLSDYSSKKEITKDDYQLVGITCLWVASKYEEIYPPRTKNYVEVTADTYSLKQMKQMEGSIIETLDFELNRITGLQILEAVKEELSEKTVSFCKYLIELSLFEGVAKFYSPYTLVLAALSLADSVFKTKSGLKLEATQKVPTDEIKACFKEMAALLENGNKYELKAVRRKFARNKYHCVAKITLSLNS